jgi:hypothetical protein
MRNELHYRNILIQNPTASVGFTLATSMIYAARFGECDPSHHGTDEWKKIARRLKSEYGENLTIDQVSTEMDHAHHIYTKTNRDNYDPAFDVGPD